MSGGLLDEFRHKVLKSKKKHMTAAKYKALNYVRSGGLITSMIKAVNLYRRHSYNQEIRIMTHIHSTQASYC